MGSIGQHIFRLSQGALGPTAIVPAAMPWPVRAGRVPARQVIPMVLKPVFAPS